MTAKILDLAAIKVKQETEDAGEWYTYDEGGRFLVAFIGREDFGRKLTRLEDSIRQQRPDLKKKDGRGNYIKKLPPEMSEEVGFKAMYGTLVLDWSDIGEPCIDFTEENFVKVLKAVRGLGNAILEFSSERENYRREQAEAELGKLTERLRWELNWISNFDQKQREQLLKLSEDGFPVPVLDDAPILGVSQTWVMDLFRDLRSCRPIGMSGYGQIPVTAIRTYFDQCGMPESKWWETKMFIIQLDAIELEFFNSKHPSRAASSNIDPSKSDIKRIGG